MISPVQKILFPALPYDKKEILRYAGCERETEDFSPLFQACLEEAKGTFTPQVAYLKTNVTIRESLCDFGVFSFRSEHLSRLLKDCDEAVLFAATVGIGIDRLILRNTKISPTKALLFSAIGSQQVEALCDAFCEALKKEG